MRISIFAGLLSLLVIAQALKVAHHQADREDLIVGGYSSLSTDTLSDDAKEIDEYIRKLHTDLKGAKLISASKQVVAGFNYHYIYRSADGKKEWDIVVYKNLKGKLFENGFSFT